MAGGNGNGNGNGAWKIHLGSTGTPFFTSKSTVPDYKDGLPNDMKPQLMSKVQVDILDLSDKDDLARYKEIWDCVGLRTVTVFFEKTEWLEDKQNWKVFIRWALNGSMDPGEFRDTRQSMAHRVLNRS